jgi:hypothetical protein
MTDSNNDLEQQRLFLIPAEEVPEWFEVEAKGVAITTEPQYGKRVTMVISGVVDKVAVAKDSKLNIPIVKFKVDADRAMVLDVAAIADLANERFLAEMETFLTAEDFEEAERAKIENRRAEAEGTDGPPAGVDPETGEKLDGDGDEFFNPDEE